MNTSLATSRDSLYFTIAGLLPFATSFLMLPIYTRYLSPEDYGVLSLINIFGMLVAQFMSMQLGSALPRFYFDFDDAKLKILFSTLLFSILLVSTIVLCTIVVLGDDIVTFLFPKSKVSFYPYFLMSLLCFLLSQVSGLVQFLLVAQQQAGIVLKRTAIGMVVGISMGIVFVVYLDMGIYGALSASIIEATVLCLLNLWYARKWIAFIWDYELSLTALRYSWPIVPHALGNYIFMYSDRIILEKFVPISVIGIYAIADKFASILKTVVNSTNNAFQPQFLRIGTKDRLAASEYYAKLLTKWFVYISIISLSMALFSEEVIRILTPEDFHEAYNIIPILVLGYLFRGIYNFTSAPIFLDKKTQLIPVVTLSTGAINVALNILLIPFWGIYAAAWVTTFSFFCAFLFSLWFSNREMPIAYEWMKLLIMLVFSIAAYLFVRYIDLSWGAFEVVMKFFVVCCLCVVFYCVNFGEIKSDISEVLNMRGFQKWKENFKF